MVLLRGWPSVWFVFCRFAGRPVRLPPSACILPAAPPAPPRRRPAIRAHAPTPAPAAQFAFHRLESARRYNSTSMAAAPAWLRVLRQSKAARHRLALPALPERPDCGWPPGDSAGFAGWIGRASRLLQAGRIADDSRPVAGPAPEIDAGLAALDPWPDRRLAAGVRKRS